MSVNIMPGKRAGPIDKARAVPKETIRHSADVIKNAREILAAHPHFRGRDQVFNFDIHEDVLIVRGSVPSFYLKQMLQNALKDLSGIRRIDNRVSVVSDFSMSGCAN